MKSKVLLAVIFLAVISTIGVSQDKESQTEIDKPLSDALLEAMEAEADRVSNLSSDVLSLWSVKGVYVSIPDLNEAARTSGLTKEQLKTDVELKLRSAGIKVNTREEYRNSKGKAELIVSFTTNDEHFFTMVNVVFTQRVNLVRIPKLQIVAVTWSSHGGYPFKIFKEGAQLGVEDGVDDFINAYLTANPKK